MPDRRKDVLTLDEIDEVAEGYKDDLRRMQDRETLKHEHYDAYAAMKARTEFIDEFITQLRLRAGSDLDKLRRPARARDISMRVIQGSGKERR